jgi:hypothetical protein
VSLADSISCPSSPPLPSPLKSRRLDHLPTSPYLPTLHALALVTPCPSSSDTNVDGVLYGYAPEVFPTPSRGTGDALASAASRITGIFAPIIAVYSPAAKYPDGPVYASASIFVA